MITTDDQTQAQFSPKTMPFTWGYFHRSGSMFRNSLSVPPLCCPSRAGFLTGEYAQNHGVLTNVSGYSYLRDKGNTLPVWLRRAGYTTGLVGKYLNDFPALGPTPAPGWDRFFAAGGETIGYRDFDVGDDGKPRHYGESQYSTDVYTRMGERFMADAANRGSPFFLWLTYNAPHTVPDGDPPCSGIKAQPKNLADYDRFKHVPLPGGRALDEPDVSDKDRWIQAKAPISAPQMAAVKKRWRCALGSLPPIDRGFHSIVERLRDLGQLDRTVIVFTSDNGYFYGEHGIAADKKLPYEPALRVPLAISVPPSLAGGPPAAGKRAGLKRRPRADTARLRGRSSLQERPSLPNDRRPLARARCSPAGLRAWTEHRAIPIELREDFTYKAVRTPGHMYMRLTADRRGALPHPQLELYDLHHDPYELHNLLA